MAKKKAAQKIKDAPAEAAQTPLSVKESSAGELTSGELSDAEFRGRVAEKAYELFERRGGAAGHEVEDWLEAERVVREELNRESSACRITSEHRHEGERTASRAQPTRSDRHKGDRTR